MSNLPPLPPYIYGRECSPNERVWTEERVRAFAEEAVKQEREACAKAAEEVDEPGWTGYECPNTFQDGKWAAAAAIRARALQQGD
jgi:hypothetical protein